MLRNPLTFRTVEPGDGVSRRVFLLTAAASSGLTLGLRIPAGEGKAAGADGFGRC